MVKRLLSTLMVLLAVVFLLIALCVYRVNTVVLSPEPITSVLQEKQAYTQLPSLIIPLLLTREQFADMEIPDVTYEQVTEVFEQSFSPAWLQGQTEYLLEQLFHLQAPGTLLATLDLRVSLQAPKQTFVAESKKIVEGKEVPFEFQPSLIAAILPDSILIQHFFVQQNETSTQTSLHQYAQPLDQAEIDGLALVQKNIFKTQNIILRFQRAIPVVFILSALAVIVLVMMHLHSLAAALRWVGAWLFFTGLGSLTFFALPRMFTRPLLNAVERLETSSEIRHLLFSIVQSYITHFASFFLIIGCIALGGAVVSWIVAAVLARKRV